MPNEPRSIDVEVRARELSAHAVQARLNAAADDAANESVARPRIEAVLTACNLVRQQLESFHRRYAEGTDLNLTGYSRASAIWLLSGRVLGLHRAMLVQIQAGICAEAVVTGRAIHEAARILFAFTVRGTDDLVRMWLDDEGRHGYVKQGAAREAEERFSEELARVMTATGLPQIPSTKAMTEEVYDHLSRVAHSRRSSCVDAVWAPGRQMAYGWHPSAIRRAGYASWAAAMTTEVLNAVGDALHHLYGTQKFFTEEIVPLRASVEAVRQSAPLDEKSIRRAAGTERHG